MVCHSDLTAPIGRHQSQLDRCLSSDQDRAVLQQFQRACKEDREVHSFRHGQSHTRRVQCDASHSPLEAIPYMERNRLDTFESKHLLKAKTGLELRPPMSVGRSLRYVMIL